MDTRKLAKADKRLTNDLQFAYNLINTYLKCLPNLSRKSLRGKLSKQKPVTLLQGAFHFYLQKDEKKGKQIEFPVIIKVRKYGGKKDAGRNNEMG